MSTRRSKMLSRAGGMRLSTGLTVGLLVLLSACGNGDADGQDDAEPASESSTGSEQETDDAATNEEPSTIRQVQVLNSMTYLPVLAADEEGYFAEEGIELETVQVANPQAAISALLSGEGDYFMASPVAAAQAADAGGDLKVWASIYAEPVAEWVMRGELADELGLDEDSSLDEKLDALPGLNIGLTAPNSPPDMLFRYVANERGWNVEQDFNVQMLGGDGIAPAFADGRVDVMITGSPAPDVAETQFDGFRLLSMQTGEYEELAGLTSVVAMSSGAWLEENPELWESWSRAVERGMQALADDPALANEIAESAFVNLDPEARELAVENVLPGVPTSTDLEPDMLARVFEVHEAAFGFPITMAPEDLLPQ